MKEFRIFYALFTVVAAVMCVCYSSRLMPILLAVMLITLLMSFLLSSLSFLFLKVTVEPIPEAVFRKDEETLTVRVRNGFFMPLNPLMAYVRVSAENKLLPENRVIITSVKPYGSVTLKIANVMSFRGEYEVGLEKVGFYDIMRLCRFEKTFKQKRVTLSEPRRIMLKDLREDNEDENENAANPNGFNKNVFSHLREYREGDTLRHIHWKLSARYDDLIVKHLEQNYNNAALIFCDFTGDYPTSEAALNDSDPCIEAALAIIRRILLGQNQAHFIYQDTRTGKSEEVRVTDAEALAELERSLTLLPPEAFPGSFTELLTEYESEIWADRAVYIITPNLMYELVEMIRSFGLTLRRNAVIAIVNPADGELADYLKRESKTGVFRIENDDIGVLGEGGTN